jgi:hypothetical protein
MTQLINEAKRMQHLAGLVNESQLEEALNKDIRKFGDDVMKRLQQAGFEVEFGFKNDLSHTNMGTEIRKKIEDNPKYIYLTLTLSNYMEQMYISANPKSKKEIDNVLNKFQTSTKDGVEKTIRSKGMFAGPDVLKQVMGALNPGDIYSWGWKQYGNMIIKDYLRNANITTQTKSTEKGGIGSDKVTYSKGTTKTLPPQQESLDIESVVNEALAKVRINEATPTSTPTPTPKSAASQRYGASLKTASTVKQAAAGVKNVTTDLPGAFTEWFKTLGFVKPSKSAVISAVGKALDSMGIK